MVIGKTHIPQRRNFASGQIFQPLPLLLSSPSIIQTAVTRYPLRSAFNFDTLKSNRSPLYRNRIHRTGKIPSSPAWHVYAERIVMDTKRNKFLTFSRLHHVRHSHRSATDAGTLWDATGNNFNALGVVRSVPCCARQRFVPILKQ